MALRDGRTGGARGASAPPLFLNIKCVPKKMLLGQKFPISKKSLKVALHSRNLVKMTTSCANHFDKVLWLLEKNCDFSIYTKIWI